MMDAATAPTPAFDADAMLAGLLRWVETESPTYDAAAVGRMMDVAARDLAMEGARIERIPGRMGFGDCVRARFPHPAGDAAPGILVLAHLDTVHPVGTLRDLPIRREGGRCYGPGIFDMKGGTFLAFEAVRALRRAGHTPPLPVTFLLTSDEEVGSPSTRDLIEAEARRARYVLVPEPARPDGGPAGGLVTGRYAIARFNLRTVGRPSHAGATLSEGRSAVREMCRQVLAIEAMTTEACTFSVSVVHGGRWVNCVPTVCEAECLTMARRQPDLDEAVARMLALRASSGDIRMEVTRGVTRPVWEPDAGTMALYEQARGVARSLGFDIGHGSAGGGSDGNFTGALGIPTLDGLGVQGGGAHTLEEHIEVASLPRRAALFAGLVASLA